MGPGVGDVPPSRVGSAWGNGNAGIYLPQYNIDNFPDGSSNTVAIRSTATCTGWGRPSPKTPGRGW
jgi:hypothetical protein